MIGRGAPGAGVPGEARCGEMPPSCNSDGNPRLGVMMGCNGAACPSVRRWLGAALIKQTMARCASADTRELQCCKGPVCPTRDWDKVELAVNAAAIGSMPGFPLDGKSREACSLGTRDISCSLPGCTRGQAPATTSGSSFVHEVC